VRIDAQIHRARAIVLVENLLPGLSAVARTEHAALRIRRVGMPERGDINHVGVRWIDANSRNRLGIAEPDMLPRLPGVHRFVHTIALHDVAAQFGFAHAQVDHVGVRFGDGHRAHRRALKLPVGHRFPRRASVRGLPQTTAHRAEIVFVGTRCAAGGGDRPSSAQRANAAPLECAEYRRIVMFRDGNRGGDKE